MDDIIKCLKTIFFRLGMCTGGTIDKNHEFVIRRNCEQIGELIEKHGLQNADVWDYIGDEYGDEYVFDFMLNDMLRF